MEFTTIHKFSGHKIKNSRCYHVRKYQCAGMVLEMYGIDVNVPYCLCIML